MWKSTEIGCCKTDRFGWARKEIRQSTDRNDRNVAAGKRQAVVKYFISSIYLFLAIFFSKAVKGGCSG